MEQRITSHISVQPAREINGEKAEASEGTILPKIQKNKKIRKSIKRKVSSDPETLCARHT